MTHMTSDHSRSPPPPPPPLQPIVEPRVLATAEKSRSSSSRVLVICASAAPAAAHRQRRLESNAVLRAVRRWSGAAASGAADDRHLPPLPAPRRSCADRHHVGASHGQTKGLSTFRTERLDLSAVVWTVTHTATVRGPYIRIRSRGRARGAWFVCLYSSQSHMIRSSSISPRLPIFKVYRQNLPHVTLKQS